MKRQPILLAFVVLVLLFLALPIFIIVPMSFSEARFLSFPPPGYSLRWYTAFFTNPAWLDAAKTSLTVAVLATVIATPIGIAAAYAISNSTLRVVRWIRAMLLLPLMIPVIIVAIGVFFVYAQMGLIATMTGLVLANVMLGLPYMVISVTAGLASFDINQEMAARSLGMNRFRSVMAVTLPQIRPSIVSGAVFVFISALDETIVSLFISGGQNQTLTKRMFTSLRDEIDPTIAAISTLLTAASFVLVMVVALSRRKKNE
ncbi:ABC transporter permease [Pigmentiphaga aceris]|uniref:ABC transporter permease n=1 Tax=Pigmentiphaga aceris TaxID=1940612 RepID=A0A5C0B2J9_9BURK|nr:ABC transporter permease [Pigmentiphaga aceris]QEI08475.1 ABC transporter permease [Pigmentiphaga aceris]